jgi:import inner membrane translocase subunit TIM50
MRSFQHIGRALARGQVISRPLAFRPQTSSASVVLTRFYSKNNHDDKPGKSADPAKEGATEEAASEQSKQIKSLLTDDILEAAGMDTSKKSGSDILDQISDEQRKRWEGTAKKSTTKTSTDLKREKRSNYFYAFLAGSALAGGAYMARDWEDEEKTAKQERGLTTQVETSSGMSASAIYERLRIRASDMFEYFNEPIFEKLLPDPLPEPYGRPMTLVLSLDDLLIHSEWTREHGWRTAKRPGVDYFLGYLAQYYEIVIFSSKYMMYSEKTVAKLDPYRSSISYALYREATRYNDGKVIKDMSNLNRNLGKVILIDTEADSAFLQPDNAILMKPWKGDAKDQDLARLIPFLEWVATQPVKDIRPILKSFHGTNVPEEYARRESIARKKFEEDWYKQHKANGGNNWAAKFLGVQPPAPPAPMMPQDYIRQEGQKGYEAFQKYLLENGEKMLAEEKEREREILNDQKFTLNKLVTEGLPNPEEIAALQLQKEKERQAKENSANV